MKIHEVLTCIGTREVPLIHKDTQIDNVILMMAKQVHARLIYVVDGQ